MFFTVISRNVQIKGVQGVVFEVSINDSEHIFIFEEHYNKLNNGEFHLLRDKSGITLIDTSGNVVPKVLNVF